MNDELINKIDEMLNCKLDKNIPCCEDSTHDFDAYNNLDNMYNVSNKKYEDINVFKDYLNVSIEELANLLNVDYFVLNNLFINNHIPSKGLASAIAMALKIKYDDVLIIFNKLGYNFNKSDYDRIIEYFFIN